MPTGADILVDVSVLMNDSARAVYTDAVCLPYLNMALKELEELFEQNNIPITNEVSAVITVPIAQHEIGFPPNPPVPPTVYLPTNLIEIQRIWESDTGQRQWTPLVKKDFLPHYYEGTDQNRFLIWSWYGQAIHLNTVNTILDLKIDYIRSLFAPLIDADLVTEISVINAELWLKFRTASFCAQYIGENPDRATALMNDASAAIERSLGISTKGRQAIMTRRRPFRAAFKNRGVW